MPNRLERRVNAIASLATLLNDNTLTVTVRPERIGRPCFFDADYNVALLSGALRELGKRTDTSVRLNIRVLSLAQFLASRPALLQPFLVWHRRQRRIPRLELEAWPLLPRGFLVDGSAPAVLRLLRAHGVISLDANDCVVARGGEMDLMADTLADLDLFTAERRVFASLRPLNLSMKVLGCA